MNTLFTTMQQRAETLNQLLFERDADFVIVYHEVWKNNSLNQAYVLQGDTQNCCPTIYFDREWYDKSDAEVVDYLEEMYQRHAVDADVSKWIAPAYVRKHIYPRLVSEANSYELELRDVVFRPFLDMLVLFYIEIDSFPGESDQASIQVTGQLLKQAGLTIDSAFELAVNNLESKIKVRPMLDYLAGLVDLDDFGEASIPMIICSNTANNQGAAVVLCPSLFSQLEEKIGDKIAILPSSIHECLAVPYASDADIAQYRDMVESVNCDVVAEPEILTDSVYILTADGLRIA